MKTITDLHEILAQYEAAFPDEDTTPVREFLNANSEFFSRKNFSGHITGSVVWIDSNSTVLLIVNPKFPDKLVFPGGHIEASDASIENGAVRELQEELSVSRFSGDTLLPIPFDIDTHWVAANPKRGEPKHLHFDFRFAYVSDAFPPFTPDRSEVSLINLIPVGDLKGFAAHARLAHKLEQVFTDTKYLKPMRKNKGD